jgi:hypothetical protein
MTDPRPTQAEVEAKAAEMFGEGWKVGPQRQIRQAEAFITECLDEARRAVAEEQR